MERKELTLAFKEDKTRVNIQRPKKITLAFKEDKTRINIQQNKLAVKLDNRLKVAFATTTDVITHTTPSGKVMLSNYLNDLENEISELKTPILRTVDEKPSDIKVGQYIFKKIK